MSILDLPGVIFYIFYYYFGTFLGPHSNIFTDIPKVQTYSRTFSCISCNNWQIIDVNFGSWIDPDL